MSLPGNNVRGDFLFAVLFQKSDLSVSLPRYFHPRGPGGVNRCGPQKPHMDTPLGPRNHTLALLGLSLAIPSSRVTSLTAEISLRVLLASFICLSTNHGGLLTAPLWDCLRSRGRHARSFPRPPGASLSCSCSSRTCRSPWSPSFVCEPRGCPHLAWS